MHYWLYKNNREGGPAGYWGDWREMVFQDATEKQWGGHYSTLSPEVAKRLNEDVSKGDVVVAYQTNDKVVVGFCRIESMTGPTDEREIWLRPIELLDTPFPIHDAKHGTILERSIAVNGKVMLRELSADEMECLVDRSGAPKRVLRGRAAANGYRPPKQTS